MATEQIGQYISAAVGLSQRLPDKDELRFLERQPGFKQLVKQTNIQLVGLMSEIGKFIKGENCIPQNQLTVPFKTLEPILDAILEKVEISLDKLDNQDDGFETVAPRKIIKIDKEEPSQPPKPPQIYGFQEENDFNRGPYPFIPIIKEKLFAEVPLNQEIIEAQQNPKAYFDKLEENLDEYEFPHPYEEEIRQLEAPAQFYDPPEQIAAPARLGEAHIITTLEDLVKVIESIEELVSTHGQTEIAVDLEHYHNRSYLGLTCLIQITTRRQEDFLIDPFPLWKDLHILGRIMHNPKIIKVLHGAKSDVEWLQRDFGVYIVGLFDTFHAANQLCLPQKSYAFLLEYYCRQRTDKTFQLADWTTRPLTADMIKYAQMDTHYLLYIYDRMKIDLYNMCINLSLAPSTKIQSVFSQSKDVALNVFRKPSQVGETILNNHLMKARQTLDSQRYETTLQLMEWREKIAQKYDENPKIMLPNHHLFKIIDLMPQKASDIFKVTGGERQTHYVIKRHASEIVRICLQEGIRKVIGSQKPKQNQETPQAKTPQADVMQNQLDSIYLKRQQFIIEPFEIELNNYDEDDHNIRVINEQTSVPPKVNTIRKQFELQSSFDTIRDTQLGQMIIKNIANAEISSKQKLNHQSSVANQVPQQRVNMEEFVAFTKEKGEKPKEKQQSYKLFPEEQQPQSLQEKFGTQVSKKRRAQVQDNKRSSNFSNLKMK